MQTNNKLREALSEIVLLTVKAGVSISCDVACGIIASKAKHALKQPPRNCDVGTSDDWLSRFSVVCERCSGSDCDHRLFKDEEVCDCFARWLQMPYEEGDVK